MVLGNQLLESDISEQQEADILHHRLRWNLVGSLLGNTEIEAIPPFNCGKEMYKELKVKKVRWNKSTLGKERRIVQEASAEKRQRDTVGKASDLGQ